MEPKTFLPLTVVIISLLAPAAYAQSTIIDLEVCQSLGYHCGRKEDGASQQYCCIEINGLSRVHTCCNPYIGLAIGLSVAIPLLVAVIIGLIVAYCWCSRYHNRKMDRLMIAFRQAQLEDEQEEDGIGDERVNSAAPPVYTPVASSERDKPEAGLPVYTESDPFAPQSTDTAAVIEPTVEQQSTETQLDDVPLLPDENDTETV